MFREAFTDYFLEVPDSLKMRLIYDRGITVYFADPHSPWQRGACENTNGLIRDFFPKGTDFSKISYEEIKHVQDILNERIRKTLNWKSPEYVFKNLIGAIKT
ncbi:MAG: hypothetical protein K1060chlam5_00946 [Candidatus Anoxychlamydiales bacterium]|nr:hypothetical protein [Candidatus Anoxychlamydiales bacterium]